MPDARPAPRSSLPVRLRMHAGYHWRNNGHPLLTRVRAVWDSRGGAVFPSVRSDLGEVSVGYSGLSEGLAYTLEFTELRREQATKESARRTEGQVTGGQLRSPARLPDTDIVIVGTSAAHARRLPAGSSLIVPMRVHFVVDLDDGPEAVHRRISKREREQFSRIRRAHRWSWDLDSSPEWFDVFYDRYYRPTMFRRHGTRERTEAKDVAYECLFRTGRMFVLSQDGERVGGALCHWDRVGRVLTLRLLGVADGTQQHYSSGAFKAIYHFLIDWSARNGVRRLDFQGTEPFLSKGTYQWKRRFGTRVIQPPNHFGAKRLWFHVRRDTPAVRDFLAANPLLAETPRGQLEAVYFQDAERPPRLEYSAKSPGVEGIRHVDLDAFLAPTAQDRLYRPGRRKL
ncbi:hypothetical protein ELQ87_39185 [Streptomyces griseoviridis]|uniref:GNAT family N-acetyltransferase n=1 Tax=Streptomyces griseoviridis TaxID=45398 RepID=A0A3S9ZPA6_STRGD|nr:hypothetical protein [Streptomyces griseoviridis]AZS89604.1 hypothetical protein ELQ87_39185 [Streptomyces griseoviridis]QCN83558.1 hypothetical protein DDJ31_00050 [Streptomyces griseoviridis]